MQQTQRRLVRQMYSCSEGDSQLMITGESAPTKTAFPSSATTASSMATTSVSTRPNMPMWPSSDPGRVTHMQHQHHQQGCFLI